MKLEQLIMTKGIKNPKGSKKSNKQKDNGKNCFGNLLCINIESLFKNNQNNGLKEAKNRILNSKSKSEEKKILVSSELTENLFIYANKEIDGFGFCQGKIEKLEKEITNIIKTFKKGIKHCSKDFFVYNFSKKLKAAIKGIFKDIIKKEGINLKGLDNKKIMLDPNISIKINELAKNIYKNLNKLEGNQLADVNIDAAELIPEKQKEEKIEIAKSVKGFLQYINKASQNNGNKKVLLKQDTGLKETAKGKSQKSNFPKEEIKLEKPAEEQFNLGNAAERLNTNQPFKVSKLEQAIFKVLNRQDIEGKSNFKEEITLKLEPESLGKVKINISSDKEQVNLVIKTHLYHTSEILKENIALLKNNLSNKGLEMNQVIIEMDNKMGSKKGREEFNDSFSKPKQSYSKSNFSLDDFELGIGSEYQIRPNPVRKDSHYLNLLI